MTGANFTSLVRMYANADSTIMSDTNLLLLANAVKDGLANRVVSEADEDYFEMPATTDLVADQREYSLPTDLLKSLTRVEAKFNDSDWIPLLEEVDLLDVTIPIVEADIIEEYGNNEGEAYFDMTRNGIYILSGEIDDVTAGLKMWYNAYPTDLVAGDLVLTSDLSVPTTTTGFAIPRQLHEVWARETAYRWKVNRDAKYQPTDLEERLHLPIGKSDTDNAIRSLRDMNKMRDIFAATPFNDGSNY